MVNPITHATQSEPVAPATGASGTKSLQSAPQAHAEADSVQLSKSAQATLAVLQELRETSSQTAKEAAHGDLQAQRLLAKEADKLVTK